MAERDAVADPLRDLCVLQKFVNARPALGGGPFLETYLG
jgi:hypothetical protein